MLYKLVLVRDGGGDSQEAGAGVRQKCWGLALGQMEGDKPSHERQQQGLKEGSGYKEMWRVTQDEGSRQGQANSLPSPFCAFEDP